MSGDRGGFTPKGFVKLREVIEAIGKAAVPDWTGAEQESENWEAPNDPRIRMRERAEPVWKLSDGPHVRMRERAERVWSLLRPEFHDNSRHACVVLDDRGEISPVPAGVWALPEAETLLRSCEFYNREIFVREEMLKSLLSLFYITPMFYMTSRLTRWRDQHRPLGTGAGVDDSDDHETPKKQRFSQAKAERAYKVRVENWPADDRPPSRADDESWLKNGFNVPRGKAREIRNEHAPLDWLKSGAPKSGKK